MRPTRIRYVIVFVAMLAAVLLYLERVCVSVAEVYIREDLRIGKMGMDVAFGAFFIAYALAQVPSGWLSQRYGPRLMLTLYMLGWSIFGVFIALAQDVYTLVAARFLLGLSQAGAYPTAAVLVKRWVPDRSRGLASSIVAFGGRFGGAGANWLTGVLIIAFVPITTPATITSADVLNNEGFQSVPSIQVKLNANPQSGDDKEIPKDPKLTACRVLVLPAKEGGNYTAEEIVEAVNAVIRNPKVFENLDWSTVSLPSDGKRIRAIPTSERSTEESERLNRLVIEKAFPGSIRQLHVNGWRPSLFTYGVLGIFVGALFWLFTRNWPRDHRWVNEAELELIESGQSQSAQAAGSDAIPWKELIGSRNQWLFSATNFFSNIGWVFLITLLPRFLSEKFSVPVDQRGLMTTIPLFVAAFGMIVGGWATDRISRSYGRKWGRAIPMGAFKFPCAIALLISAWLPDAWSVVIALTFMSVCQDFGIPAVWAFAQDTGGKQVGAVIGWGNMWGNFGAGLAPPLVGGLAAAFGWNSALFFGAGAFVFCGITGMMTNAAEPLFRVEEKPS